MLWARFAVTDLFNKTLKGHITSELLLKFRKALRPDPTRTTQVLLTFLTVLLDHAAVFGGGFPEQLGN